MFDICVRVKLRIDGECDIENTNEQRVTAHILGDAVTYKWHDRPCGYPSISKFLLSTMIMCHKKIKWNALSSQSQRSEWITCVFELGRAKKNIPFYCFRDSFVSSTFYVLSWFMTVHYIHKYNIYIFFLSRAMYNTNHGRRLNSMKLWIFHFICASDRLRVEVKYEDCYQTDLLIL